jgi:hypothetical protein
MPYILLDGRFLIEIVPFQQSEVALVFSPIYTEPFFFTPILHLQCPKLPWFYIYLQEGE